MSGLGYVDRFKELVNEKSIIKKGSREGDVVQRIIDVLCEYDLMAFEGLAILEKCADEVIRGSKIKKC